jgi:hypothetical protein
MYVCIKIDVLMVKSMGKVTYKLENMDVLMGK